MKQLCSTRFWRSVLAFALAMMMPFNAVAGTLTLPAAVKVVEKQAFENNTSVNKVVLPAAATTIESQAFKGATALECVVIPESVTSIADDAFEGVEGLIVETARNSYAWHWAVAHEYAVQDPASPFEPVVYEQHQKILYLNGSNSTASIGFAMFDIVLGDDVTIDWSVEKISGDDVAALSVQTIKGNQQEADIVAESIVKTGTANWQISAVTSEGESWSETITLTVEELPDGLPTEIIVPEVFNATVGRQYRFMPSEQLSHNGTIPEGVYWSYNFDISGDITNNETVSYPLVNDEVGFAFTPDSEAEYQFTVMLNIANHTISADAKLVISPALNNKVSFARKLTSLYLEGNIDPAQIGWVSYDGLLSDSTIGSGKIVSYDIERISGDECVELFFDEYYVCEVWARNITATGESVWRVSAVLSDGSSWYEDITVSVVNMPENYPTEIICPEMTVYVGETFEFNWDMVSLNAELPEDAEVIKRFRAVSMGNYQSFTPTENGFTFVPTNAGDRTLELSYVIGNYEIKLSTVISVVEEPAVEFSGRLLDTVYADGSANGYLLGNLVPQVETAEGDEFEWSIALKESSTATPAAEIGFNRIFAPTGPAVIGLMSLSGEAGTVTYTISVKHGENNYAYDYTLNVVESPAAMPTGITVPATSYQIEVDGTLSLNVTDIHFEGGQVPEGVSANFNYAWNTEDVTGLTIGNGAVVNITGVTPGTYTISACAAILNREYTLPITIEVKSPVTPVEFGGRVMDTVYATGSADGFLLGNLVPQVETADGDEFEWSIALKESSNATPAAEIGFLRFFGPTGPAMIGLTSLSGEAGTVTYTIGVKHGENNYAYDYTLNVVEAPATLPTGITVPATSYQIAVDEVLSLSMLDTRFVGGQVPEGVSANYSFSWDAEETGLTVRNSGTSVNITGVTPGTYTISACAAILNREYAQPITIEVKSPVTPVEFGGRVMDTVYATGSADGFLLGNLVPQVETADGDEFEWSIALKESSTATPAAEIGFLRFFAPTGPAMIGLTSLSGEAGTVTYTIGVKHGENNYAYDYTLNVVEAPATLPTGITVPATSYQIAVDEVLSLSMLDTRFVGGQVPESVSANYSFSWDAEETGLTVRNSGTSLNITGVTPGTYTISACAAILNREYAQPITIEVKSPVTPVEFGGRVMDTVYATGSADGFLLGNLVPRVETVDGDEFEWSIALKESSTATPAAEIGFLRFFGPTGPAMIVLTSLSGEAGTVTYTIGVKHGENNYAYDYTLNVVEAPATLPTGITVPATSYQIAVDEVLSLSMLDTLFVGGQVPESVSANYSFSWDAEETGLTVRNSGTSVNITGVTPGTYTISACAAILNREYAQPITITVAEETALTFSLHFPTLYLGGNQDEIGIGGFNYPGELADAESIQFTVDKVSGDEGVELFIDGGVNAYFGNVKARNINAVGSSVWRAKAVMPDGTEVSEEFTVTVAEMPENYPTTLIDPQFTGRVGEVFEFDWNNIVSDGVAPEDDNQWLSSLGLFDIFNHETYEFTDNGFTFVPDRAGNWQLRVTKYIANHKLEIYPVIAVEGSVEMELFHYFKTLYLEGNQSETDIAEIHVDTVLANDEAINYQVEYVSGDKVLEMSIVGISEDGLTAYVLASNLSDVGESSWKVSAAMPNGTVLSEEITVSVAHMPEDFPTELIVDYPVRGNVGERFVFKPSELMSFDGVVPDDGNTMLTSLAYYGEIWEHPTHEIIDDGHFGAFAFTPDADARYGFSLYCYLANHCLEHHGIIIIGDGNSNIGRLNLNVIDTMYLGVRDNEDQYWFGNAYLDRFHTLPGEEINWTLEPIEYTGDEPVIELELTDRFENTHGVNIDVMGMTGETGSVTYRVTANWGESYWSKEFTVNVEEEPEGLPTGITVPATSYEVEVGETLNFRYDDIELVGGSVPENVEPRFDYWIHESLTQQQNVNWMDGYVSVNFRQDGSYTIEAVAQIGNKEYVLPISIKVGDGISADARLKTEQNTNIVYYYSEEWNEAPRAFVARVEGYDPFEGDSFEWNLEQIAGDHLANVFINDYFDDDREVAIGVDEVGQKTGRMTYRLTVTTEGGLELSCTFNIEVQILPQDMPTDITVPATEYAVSVGDKLYFPYSAIEFADGNAPEGNVIEYDYWLTELLHKQQRVQWDDNGLSIEFVKNGRYQIRAAVRIGNYVLTKPITIIVGDGVSSETTFNTWQPMPVAFTNCDGAFALTAWIENYELFEGEGYDWNLEQLEGSGIATASIGGYIDNGSRVDIHLHNTEDRTGLLKFRLTVTTEGGLNYSHDFTIDVRELPAGMPTEMTLKQCDYLIEEGDTLEFLYSDIGFGEGTLPEGVEPVFEYWHLDQVEDHEWTDEGLTVTYHDRGFYHGVASARIGNYMLTKDISIKVGGEDVGIMLTRPTTTHYINDDDFTWSGDLRMEEAFRLEDERIEWDLERIDNNGTNPAEVYLDNEFDDSFGIGVYLHNFSGETGSMTYRFTATSNMGGSWYVDHTFHVEQMPDNFPTGINMPNDGILYLEPGSTVIANYDMVEFVGGELPEDAEVYIEFWTDTVEEYGDPFEWTDTGFTSVLNGEGRYFFHAVAYVNGIEMIKPVCITIGDGVPENAELQLDRLALVQYYNPEAEEDNWPGTIWLDNYPMFPGEKLEWSVQLLSGNASLAELYLECWDEPGADMRLRNFSGDTGSMTWRVSAQNEDGHIWYKDITFEIATAPDYLPDSINMPNDGRVYLDPGDTLVARYDMIFFEGGEPSETDIVYMELWPDEIAEVGEPFEWHKEGFTAVMNREGRYSFRAFVLINGIVYMKEISVTVGDAEQEPWLNLNVTDTMYLGVRDNEDQYWFGTAYLDRFHTLPGEVINWTLEPIEYTGDEPVIELELTDRFENTHGVNIDVMGMTGETGSVTYRVTANWGESYWSKEFTVNVEEEPEGLPTGITVPATSYEVEVGETLNFRYDDIELVGGSVPENVEPRFDYWKFDSLTEQQNVTWMDGYISVNFRQDGSYTIEAVAQIGNKEYVLPISIKVGDGISADARLETEQNTNIVYYYSEEWNEAPRAFVARVEGYDPLEGDSFEWNLEQIAGDHLANVFINDYFDDDREVAIGVDEVGEDTGTMTYRLTVTTEGGLELSCTFNIEVQILPQDMPTDITVPATEYAVSIGDTLHFPYSAIEFADGNAPEGNVIEYDYWLTELLHKQQRVQWDDNGLSIEFVKNGRYQIRAAVRIGNYVLTKPITIIVGDGVREDVELVFMQNTHTAYATTEDCNAWIGCVEIRNYEIFDDEDVCWWVERIDKNEGAPLNAYVDNLWDERDGANIHVDSFSGETGEMEFRIHFRSTHGFETYTDFTLNVVEMPDNLPTILHVPADHLEFEIGEEFVIHDYDLTVSEEDGVVPEGASLHYEYWDPFGTFYDQEVMWNEEEGGVTVRFHNEGRYKFTVALQINTYKLIRTIHITVGDAEQEPWLNLHHSMNTLYAGMDEDVHALGIDVQDYELADGESYAWNLEQISGDENLMRLYINNSYDNDRGVNLHATDFTNRTGSATYRLTVTTNEGMELSHEFTINQVELPEGLPTEVSVTKDHYIDAGDIFTFEVDDIQFSNGTIPEGEEAFTEWHCTEQLQERGEWVDIDGGFRVTLREEGVYRFLAVKRINNYLVREPVTIYVGDLADKMIYSVNQFNPLYNNFEDRDEPVDELETLFLQSHFHLLTDEKIHWDLEILNDDGNLPAELYIQAGQDYPWMNIHARNSTGTGTIEYRVTATLENGVSYTYENTVDIVDMPENLPTEVTGIESVYEIDVGEWIEFHRSDLGYEGGEVPEGTYTRPELWVDGEIQGQSSFEWIEDGFGVSFDREGRYFFDAAYRFGSLCISKRVAILVGSGIPEDAYIYPSQNFDSIHAYQGAEPHTGCYSVQLFELAEGENFSWAIEKISDENVSPCKLIIENPFDNNRGINVRAVDVTGETGSVTYRLSVTTEKGLYLYHDITLEVTEGRSEDEPLPTDISVPREEITVYANNVIVLRRSDIQFADGVVLDDDYIETDYWNLECLGDQTYGWDGEGSDTLTIHFTEVGTYELVAFKSIGGINFTKMITINVVERGENDPFVNWAQDVHTIYTGVEDESTWIGWGVLNNYEVTEENTVNWTFERIDYNDGRPVDLYFEVFDGVHADVRYANARRPGNVIYRLICETSDGFMDSREFWLNIEELPENLPTELNMQTLYELNVGDTFEFDATEVSFKDGVVPENASQRTHVRNMDAFYALDGFDWTDNGFIVPNMPEGRYVFTFGMQIGNYTVPQDVAVVVGNPYPSNASLDLRLAVDTLFNDTAIENAWLGQIELYDYPLAQNEQLYWNIERIDENESNPVVIEFGVEWDEGRGLRAHSFSGETGEVTMLVTVSSNTGFALSEEFTIIVIETPDNLPTELTAIEDHTYLNLGDYYAFSNAGIMLGSGHVPEEITPYYEVWVDESLMELPGFSWLGDDNFEVSGFEDNGRYSATAYVYLGGYVYTKEVYIYVGTGLSDNARLEGMQKIETVYLGLEGRVSDHAAWYSVADHQLFGSEQYQWTLKQTEGGELMDLRLEVDEENPENASIYIDSCSGETGSVKYELSVTTDQGINFLVELPFEITNAPEGLPTDLILPEEDYHFEVGETHEFLFADIEPAEGYIPEGALVLEEIWNMESIPGWEMIRESSDPEGDGYRVTFEENGRYEVYFAIKIENYMIVKPVIITVGDSIPEDAWVEYWGIERPIYAGLEGGWALDAQVHNYLRMPDEEFYWDLRHISGPELEIERTNGGDTWLGVWYDFIYTGDETGDSVYRLVLETSTGFYAEQDFVFHILDIPEGLPSDIVVPAEDIYLDVNETYTARYDQMRLTDDGHVPEGSEVRHELHVDETLTDYHTYEWTDDGFRVTFTEEGRYHYYAVIKVNGLEYHKEVRIIVGDGIADNVKLDTYISFEGQHYISDNEHWVADLWLENYNLFEGEQVIWDVRCNDDSEKANMYVDPIWNDGLNAALFMDSFNGQTGTASYTVYVETEGGFSSSYDFEIEIMGIPENFPKEIVVEHEDVYLDVDETYSARLEGFYSFNEGSVIPEGASWGAEFWPEELEGYHTFEWVDGGFDVTFTENGRYHFYVNAAINGVDFTKEIRLHVGSGLSDQASLRFEQAFVQHFINDQTQWIGDAYLDDYIRFDNEEIHWDVEYLDEGEPLANVFIDPVWDGGLFAGVRVNDFHGTGKMNMRLNVYTDGNFSWSEDFELQILDMPPNLPSDIVVEEEDIYLDIGETYEARLERVFQGFTDDGEILYDIAEFYYEFHVDEDLSGYHGFEWTDGGFDVTFSESGRYRFYMVASVNGIEYAKEIRLHVGEGVREDVELVFMQNTHTAYATTEDCNAWIGCAEIRNYEIFDDEVVCWWVERIDKNEGAPLNAYVDNLWDERDGANIHVDSFSGEIGEMEFRIHFRSTHGFETYTDFTLNVVEMPGNLPTALQVPSDNLFFSVNDEFVIRDCDLTIAEGDGVVPEGAALHYEYWDPFGTFYDQEVMWNEEEGGVTVRFHNEGRYEFTVALLINTYKLIRTIHITVGDGMENVYMDVNHMIDPVYTGVNGQCRIGNAYIQNFNVFEDEDIVWTITPKNADEETVGDVFVSSYWERKLGANFASENVNTTGETTYVIKAVLPTGLVLEEEITLHVEELPEGLPEDLIVPEEDYNLVAGDHFELRHSEIRFSEGYIPENAAVHLELWPDENLERLPGFEFFHDEENADDGIRVDFDEPGEYTITVAAWIGNYMLFKEIRLHVADPWKIGVVVSSVFHSSEEHVAAMKVAQTFGDEHVIVKTFPDNFVEAADDTTALIAELAEDEMVKAIIVAPSVPGTVNGFEAVREMRDDVLLISGMPQEAFDDVSAQADMMLYSDEAAQAQTIMETLSGWEVDVLVHYSFERHMALEAVSARYEQLVALGEELGIDVISVSMPDPASNFAGANNFIAQNTAEMAEEYADQKIAFFATQCGVQTTLQQAVLEYSNAYYPQPCCPSPFHGFPETLGLNLELDMNSKAALREIANALSEYGAAGRFSTWASPVNMGIIEVAGQYAAAYAQGQLEAHDGDALRQMFNAKFGSPSISNDDYDNGYAILLDPVDFTLYEGVYQPRIAVLTGTEEQSQEEYIAAQKLVETYGEDRVIVDYYPDQFLPEEGIEETISKITDLAADPNVNAIIVSQAVPGTLEGFRQVRGMRDDVMLIAGLPQEDMQDMSDVADLMLLTDEAAQAVPIMDSCENWGVEVFVHYSFERHLNNGPVMARRNKLAEKCVELGIEFVEIDIPDPAVDGYDEMVNFISNSVPQVMAEYEGKKVAFFCTNCGSQATLQNAVLFYDNAYYPQPCCPSPFHGFAESLEIELDMTGNPRNALRQIANALAEYDAVDRFSTGAESINMAFIELAGQYAMAYADGEIGLGADDEMIRQMINARLSNALIDNSIFHNGYMVVSAPVDFSQYAGVHAGKVAILTGSLNQGEEEYTAAMLAVERHGDDRVIVETYADNFYENTDQTAEQIAAFAEDPNVSAIVVAQAVPGTLEGFRRVREMRSDVLLIAGMAQEDHFEMSDVADVMLFSEEPRQAGPIMDKCVEWGVDAIVHYSFERHMSLELVKARHDEMKALAERQEIEFIDITMPDPTVAGVQQARAFITENVPAVLTEYEGKKVAFFSTNCGVQAALQSAVIANENAYYPQPCCPSPTHGFQESLNLDLPLNDSAAAIRMVANALYEKGVIDRVSTGAVAINMAIIEVAVDYAIDYADGVVKNRNDEEIIFEMIDRSMNNPIADNYVHGNVYAITLGSENMMDYVTTDDVIQLWVSEGVMDFTADQLGTFQQENPEYDDLRIHLKSVNEAEVSDKLLRRAEFGADVFGLPHDQVFELYANDMLSPLTEENAQLVTENNDAGSVAAATMVNELYAYPMTSDNGYFMYYDKSIISDQMTLEEILAACEENDRTFHMELNSGWYQVAFFFGAGCELYFDTNANGEFTLCHANYASDNGVKALKSMIKVASSPAFRNGTALELLGDMGAFVSGTWAAVDMQNLLGDNYAAMKLPTVDGYQMSAFSGYKMMGVKPQSSDHRQAACDALAMYLTSEDVQAARFEAVEWGPSNLNAQNTEALQSSEAHSALAAQMQYSVAQGQYPGEYWDLSFELGERVMSGSLNDKSDEELMEVLTQFQDEVTWVVIPQT